MSMKLIETHELEKKLEAFDTIRDWKKFHFEKDLALSVVCEATELLELFQWLSKEEIKMLRTNASFSKKVAYELADIVMYVVRLAKTMKINLDQCIVEKIGIIEQKYPVEKVKGSHCKDLT